ncbi:hypothetical protein ACFYOV_20380 [Streptomyces sp. NPDC005931]|uniref:hypothetical protein n=1 Tax=Streptomyces sp. NPDC005931 TaxID=3364737 RepID=UPI0036B254CA
MIAAHRLCTPTREDRIVDPLVERVRWWRTALGLTLTVAAWLALGLVPLRELPGQFWQGFAYGLGAVQLIVLAAWFVIAMAPPGRRWAAALRWRAPLLAFVLTFVAFGVFLQTTVRDWPPDSPGSAVLGVWLGLFGGYGGLLLILHGGRTADVNDGLPTVLSVVAVITFSLPSLGDPMYDKVPMPVRLLVGLTGPLTVMVLARWELRRLHTLHGVRLSDTWHRV